MMRDGADVLLVEVPINEDITELPKFDCVTLVHAMNNHFEISLTRYRTLPDHRYDRIFSKWVLVEKQGDAHRLLSHGRYADEVTAKNDLPDEVPRTKRGIGGSSTSGPVEYIDQLGVTSVIVNVFLDFLRTGPGADRIAFTYGGRTYYADTGKIEHYDATMRYASSHHLIVSAILLVPKRSRAQAGHAYG
jgi:hypothetical protein